MFYIRKWVVTLLVFALVLGNGGGVAKAAAPSLPPGQTLPAVSVLAEIIALERGPAGSADMRDGVVAE